LEETRKSFHSMTMSPQPPLCRRSVSARFIVARRSYSWHKKIPLDPAVLETRGVLAHVSSSIHGESSGITSALSIPLNLSPCRVRGAWCQRSSVLVFWDLRLCRRAVLPRRGCLCLDEFTRLKAYCNGGCYFFLRLPLPSLGSLALRLPPAPPFLTRNRPSFLCSLLISSRVLSCLSRRSVRP